MAVDVVVAELVEMNSLMAEAFPDQPTVMGRIEGYVDGKRYAAMVPPALVDDRPAVEAYLQHMADMTRAHPDYAVPLSRHFVLGQPCSGDPDCGVDHNG